MGVRRQAQIANDVENGRRGTIAEASALHSIDDAVAAIDVVVVDVDAVVEVVEDAVVGAARWERELEPHVRAAPLRTSKRARVLGQLGTLNPVLLHRP